MTESPEIVSPVLTLDRGAFRDSNDREWLCLKRLVNFLPEAESYTRIRLHLQREAAGSHAEIVAELDGLRINGKWLSHYAILHYLWEFCKDGHAKGFRYGRIEEVKE